MGTKKAKKSVEKQVINTEPDQREVKKTWLSSFVAPKSSASRLVTGALLKGCTLKQMQDICKEYSAKQEKPQKWGNKNSDLRGHLRWLKAKGYTVKQDDGGKYTLSV